MKGKFINKALLVISSLWVITANLAISQNYSRFIDFDELQKSREASLQSGSWDPYIAKLDQGILKALAEIPGMQNSSRFKRLISEAPIRTAITQSALLRDLGEISTKLAESDEGQAFLIWLLDKPEAMGSYLESVKQEDSLARVFEIWMDLWQTDPEGRDDYYRLALACALVLDQPLKHHRGLEGGGKTAVNHRERYQFYREADRKHLLKVQLDELPVWELVWVVDAPVPTKELKWGLEKMNLSRAKWSDAYGMIKYVMTKAVDGASLYDEYTLREILDKGGICGDQAYFAATTAKANGIPAMIISGAGQRGGHAWFGYKKSSREWNMNAGRYSSDRYATGYARNPQTRARIKEHTLLFLADPQRRSNYWPFASQLLYLSRLFAAQEKHPEAREALQLAVSSCNRHMPAWNGLIQTTKTASAPLEEWNILFKDMRAAFRKFPDRLAEIANSESEVMKEVGRVEDRLAVLEKQNRKLDSRSEDRTDLLLENVRQRATILENAEKVDEALDTYGEALKDYGGDVPVFTALCRDFMKLAKKHDRAGEVARYIEKLFGRLHQEPQNDYFAISTYGRMMKTVAGFLEEGGESRKAEKIRKDAEELMAEAKERYGEE